jgi:hypothetical protein
MNRARMAILACTAAAAVMVMPTVAGASVTHPAHASGVKPDAMSCTGPAPSGPIFLYDNNVLDASGFGNPAAIDDYPQNFGANQNWTLCEQPSGYDAIYAYYNGNYMCLNVSNSDYAPGTQLLAYQCNGGPSNNELFRQPAHTPDSNWYMGGDEADYIVPAGNYSLCLNVSGGLGKGHHVILYGQNSQNNEAMFLAFVESPAHTR